MNKQATRQAIVDAALELLRNEGREAMTATAIAEAAGISRRTLFNYFPTVDAILSDPLQRLLERVVEVLAESSENLPLIGAAIQALQGAGVPQLLAPVAYLAIYSHSCGQGHGSGQANQWQDASQDVVATIERKYPHADPFEVRIFAHSILGAGQAAFEEWTRRLATTAGQAPGNDLDISAEHIQSLHALLTHALEQLRDGFPSLMNTVETTDKDL